MIENADSIAHALRQYLLTDRFFGQTQVPIPWSTIEPARASPPSGGAGGRAEKGVLLETLDQEQVRGCRHCELCETRTNTVFGVGRADARLVFVGEGPGAEEDRQGLPFVGRAGQLLTRMIHAMGLQRDDVYICNVVKCRPPNNRDPSAGEIAACKPYLFEQLRIIDPDVVVALGAPAARTLLDTTLSVGRLRGRFHDLRIKDASGEETSIPLMPTYHPAYLLRSPDQKPKAWEDLQQVMGHLGLPLPTGG